MYFVRWVGVDMRPALVLTALLFVGALLLLRAMHVLYEMATEDEL